MPNRIIKESIRTSRDINCLSDFQFRVWAYLITYVDDYGRGSADPELLKGLVFPRRKGITEKQIGEALSVLANSGMISLYEIDGESYFYFPTWEKHQTIRAKKSRFPAPQAPELVQADASNCRQLQADASICSRNPIQSNTIQNTNPNTNTESEPPKAPQGAVRGRRKAALFDAFWEQYPRKVGKGDARKSWDKLELTEELTDRIFHALQKQKGWEQWQRDEGRFIPHPATWLNQQRWEDEGLTVVDEAERKRLADLAAWKAELEGGGKGDG